MTLIKKERRKSPINSTVVSRITEPARLFCIKKFFQYVSLFGTNVYYWKFPVCLFIFECVNFSILNESSKIMIFFLKFFWNQFSFQNVELSWNVTNFQASNKFLFIFQRPVSLFLGFQMFVFYLHAHYLKQDEMSANYCQKIVSVNIP